MSCPLMNHTMDHTITLQKSNINPMKYDLSCYTFLYSMIYINVQKFGIVKICF